MKIYIYIYITYNENFLRIHDTLYVENICIYLLFINECLSNIYLPKMVI